MIKEKNPLTIAMVTYNSREHVADCLKWFADRPSDIWVRVRDNGSTDETPQMLKRLESEGLIDELILAPDDPGFAIGANDVIRRSGNDDVILMNPDARITLDTLELMRDAVAADPDLGAVSPVVSAGEEITVMSAGRQPRLWPMITHYTGLSRLFPNVGFLRGRHLFLHLHAHQDQLVEWTSGCCLYVPRRTFDKVGLLSERWFLYGEDTEFCKRICDAGLTIKILATARAYHEVGGSTAAHSDEKVIKEGSLQLDTVTAAAAATGMLPPPDVSTMWGRNLYDYYRTAYQPTALTSLAWRTTFTAGNVSRGLVRRWRDPQDPRAGHLTKNALAVWH
ncbi:glycosyltransferase [Mycolicibacterium vaccae]|uniref:glycosyltransferase n=1 Tax=Mycolicibacterium vaccae TaxID=1810 RepID=UPI003D02663D